MDEVQQWEHCFIRSGSLFFMDRATTLRKAPDSVWPDLGKAGWDLVAVTPNYEYYFKRPVQAGRAITDVTMTWPPA